MAKTTSTSPSDKTETVTIHDQKLERGAGGELHQTAENDAPVLTTAQGGPVADDQNSLRVGPRGPLVVDDFHFREKIFHFDHERIPSVSCMHAVTARMASSRPTSLSPHTQRRISCSAPGKRHQPSSVSRRLRATRAQPTLRATCAVSQ